MSSYHIAIHTGDKKGAGTNANVWLRLQDSDGARTPWTRLDTEFRDDFQPAGVDEFHVEMGEKIKDVWRIQLWRDEAGWSPNWYIDSVTVKYDDVEYPFPVYRWIPPVISFYLEVYDTSLPQNSSTPEQRAEELKMQRRLYQYETKHVGMPPQIRDMPADEEFSVEYITKVEQRKQELRSELFGGGTFRSWGFSSYGFPERFSDMQEFEDVFEKYESLPTPKCIPRWMDDVMFGALRLAGVNTRLIKLCTKLPEKFGVDPTEVAEFLEGATLQEAMDAKKIFILDLEILEGIQAKEGFTLTKPISLYYVRNDKKLVPIAIQLYQNRAADNPVFYPNDEPYLWLLAKMFCNNGDATYHQVIAHLGNTHLMIEPFYVSFKRQISTSHPLFKLLAPHFQFMLPVAWVGGLFAEKGPLFKYMTVDYANMVKLLSKKFRDYDISGEGDLLQDLKNRQVDDPLILPNYHYRDDAILLYDAITKYVTNTVHYYYETEADIANDTELQARAWMCPKYWGGRTWMGLPEKGTFLTYKPLIAMLRYIIFTCTAEHAAVNLDSYEIYAFTPFYPALLRSEPPRDKSPRRAEDLADALPSRANVLETALTAKILSTQNWWKLGDFEIPYQADPRVLNTVVADFREDLRNASLEIARRNGERTDLPYHALDPARIGNNMPN